jgi:hypothetical protein
MKIIDIPNGQSPFPDTIWALPMIDAVMESLGVREPRALLAMLPEFFPALSPNLVSQAYCLLLWRYGVSRYTRTAQSEQPIDCRPALPSTTSSHETARNGRIIKKGLAP